MWQAAALLDSTETRFHHRGEWSDSAGHSLLTLTVARTAFQKETAGGQGPGVTARGSRAGTRTGWGQSSGMDVRGAGATGLEHTGRGGWSRVAAGRDPEAWGWGRGTQSPGWTLLL